jgi:catechol 2,3-dioxygenase-like lactoylglutathione lyase family enzyme
MDKTEGRKRTDDRIVLRRIHHVCLAVRDVEKTAEAFSAIFGVSPFRITVYESAPTRATVYGKPQGYRLKFAHAEVGPVGIELVQTLEGKSAIDDFIERRGEGIHHLAFECDPPLDNELRKWKEQGVEALQIDRSLTDDPRYGWAYMDTERLVGCVLEIMCLPPEAQ